VVKRGFKSECESIAAAVRAEMGLDARSPLDSRDLATHLGIPLHPVSSLAGNGVASAVRHVQTDKAVLSAMTIFPQWPRRHRVIIYNDANSDARQNSDVAHELSHGLLLHEPRGAIANGCRDYARAEEEEAAWLSGCLLVPREAAVVIAKAGTPLGMAAIEFGVSTQMMSFRVNSTGARRQAEASRARRQRGA
jgi:Zn-dependent peptidase ImmA (M78 family)